MFCLAKQSEDFSSRERCITVVQSSPYIPTAQLLNAARWKHKPERKVESMGSAFWQLITLIWYRHYIIPCSSVKHLDLIMDHTELVVSYTGSRIEGKLKGCEKDPPQLNGRVNLSQEWTSIELGPRESPDEVWQSVRVHRKKGDLYSYINNNKKFIESDSNVWNPSHCRHTTVVSIKFSQSKLQLFLIPKDYGGSVN